MLYLVRLAKQFTIGTDIFLSGLQIVCETKSGVFYSGKVILGKSRKKKPCRKFSKER